MAAPASLDKVVLDGLMSKDAAKVAAALDQARDLGWDLQQVQQALTAFLAPLLDADYLEGWRELDDPSVPGPRLALEGFEDATVPLVSVFVRWPGVVPFLPWLPGREARFTIYEYVDLFHDIPFDKLEEMKKDGPVWKLTARAEDWGEAGAALEQATGSLWEERDLQFNTYFEWYEDLGEALRKQAADSGIFLLGKQVEFEGNHNDAEFAVLMVKLVDALPEAKPGGRKA